MLVNYAKAAHWPVDPSRLDLVDEFRKNPRGPHSGDLQKLLHRMRWGGDPSQDGRYVVLAIEPGQLRLALLPRVRGEPVRPIAGQVFTSIKAAEWAVFKQRWRELTGHALPDEFEDLPS